MPAGRMTSLSKAQNFHEDGEGESLWQRNDTICRPEEPQHLCRPEELRRGTSFSGTTKARSLASLGMTGEGGRSGLTAGAGPRDDRRGRSLGMTGGVVPRAVLNTVVPRSLRRGTSILVAPPKQDPSLRRMDRRAVARDDRKGRSFGMTGGVVPSRRALAAFIWHNITARPTHRVIRLALFRARTNIS